MRIYLLYILTSISISCNRYCENSSTANGLDISYYKNNKKKSEVEVKNCLCSGNAKYYYPNETLYSIGKCVNGKDDGIWRFYDRNGNIVAQASWDMGKFISYTILLGNKDSINFDNNTKRLYNNRGSQINDSAILEVFNVSTETEVINDSLIVIRDYRDLIILTPGLDVKFNLRGINKNEFLKIFEFRKLHLELDNKFLKSGIDYLVKVDSVKIIMHYIDTSSHNNSKVKEFIFPFSP